MATVKPFQPYRYTPKAGDPANLVTQPYDKISPAMQAKYLAASPYNLVRIILGERVPSDDTTNNCYTRAAAYLDEWTRDGILAQDPVPAFYAYSQESIAETRKVAWPTRKETLQTTAIVFAFVVVMALFLWVVDASLLWVVKKLMGQGG